MSKKESKKIPYALMYVLYGRGSSEPRSDTLYSMEGSKVPDFFKKHITSEGGNVHDMGNHVQFDDGSRVNFGANDVVLSISDRDDNMVSEQNEAGEYLKASDLSARFIDQLAADGLYKRTELNYNEKPFPTEGSIRRR